MSGIRVEYPDIQLEGCPVVVEGLALERACGLAASILDVTVAAYSNTYEGEGRPLPSGAFAKHYGNDDARERWKARVVPSVYERGGSYWVVVDPEYPTRLAASLKILPGATVEWRFKQHKAGVAELVVAPEWQRRGLAAACLLTYLEHSGLDAYDRAMSDVVIDGPMANWLLRLGFEPEHPSGSLVVDTGNLPTRYYVSSAGVTVAGVIEALKADHPERSTVRVI